MEEEAFCDGGEAMDCTGGYVTAYAHDDYGNVIKEWNAGTPKNADPTVRYTYDAATHAYPVIIDYAVHDDIRLSEEQTWDPRFGKVAAATDVNGRTTTYAYDPFGRLEQTHHPDGGEERIIYNDTAVPRSIQSRIKEDNDHYIDAWDYFDGLGRGIQRVTVGAGQETYTVSKTHYDRMGRPFFVTGPFFHPTSGYLDWPWNRYDKVNIPGNGRSTTPVAGQKR